MISGLSLSFCIADICTGLVNETEVEKIITSTKCHNFTDFTEVVDEYCQSYWSAYPAKAKALALKFWNAGKIDQPRVRGQRANYVGAGHWMNNEGKVLRITRSGRYVTGSFRTI